MSDAVIVVESAIKGGALITADIANSYNRDVFAIPAMCITNIQKDAMLISEITKPISFKA